MGQLQGQAETCSLAQVVIRVREWLFSGPGIMSLSEPEFLKRITTTTTSIQQQTSPKYERADCTPLGEEGFLLRNA